MTVHGHVRQARERLVAAGIPAEEAALDAELLARHVLGWDRATLLARSVDEAPSGFDRPYETVIARRRRREPVAYITGRQEFWGRDFLVGPGVLIPRPETELIVEEALDWARTVPRPLHIADVGTGSGCLAVTLALELPSAVLEATDVSGESLAVARQNADRHLARVRFHLASILAGVGTPLDAIVSNPPYIPRDEYETLQPEVREHEPMTALVGGDDGLTVVRQVVSGGGQGVESRGQGADRDRPRSSGRREPDRDGYGCTRAAPYPPRSARHTAGGRRPATVLKRSSAWE